MAHYAINDGKLEHLSSTPKTGPEVNIKTKEEHNGDYRLLISLQQPIPEMNLEVGDEAWYTTDEIMIVDGLDVYPFKNKELKDIY